MDAQSLGEWKTGGRSGARCGNEPTRGRDPLMCSRAADERDSLEEARAYRFSRHRHSAGVNERSGLHTARVRDRSQRRLERHRIECGDFGKRGVERLEMLVHMRAVQMLLDGGRIVLNGFSEEKI